MSAQDFIVEIGIEELPPTALKTLSLSFTAAIAAGLTEAELSFTSSKGLLAAPRRLAFVVKGLAEQSPQKEIIAWGPPAKIAFDDDGKPDKAAIAFANKNGIAVADLKVENDGKQDKLCARSTQTGSKAVDVLPGIVQNALDQLPIAKRMRWGASRTEFVRPAHWVVMLFGSEVIPATILGIDSGNQSRGHRFHCNEDIIINNATDYEAALKSAYVIVDYQVRQAMVAAQVKAEGENIGGHAVIGEDLLDEVTGLVEWPVALTGSFEKRFLDVPAEALISSMKEHQKYFHVEDANGELMPNFITVANIESKDPAQVISGNERVIRPRLDDAAFFFATDKKTNLGQRVERLKTVVFQKQLGTTYEKTQRIAKLAAYIAQRINGNTDYAQRAGQLCKADLVSDMVLEFDKMQGIAGMYYALNDGEEIEVANAIREQYLPKFSGDKLPETLTGCAVALADRLDTLVGIFGIGQIPSGSKDPFALRRAVLGFIRIISEKQFLALDINSLLTEAKNNLVGKISNDNVVADVNSFIMDRYRAIYQDQNIATDTVMAVQAAIKASGEHNPYDFDLRIQAVQSFRALPEATALAAANKRVQNILAKQGDDIAATDVNPELFNSAAEINLFEQISTLTSAVAKLTQNREYTSALTKLAALKDSVDMFFDDVMVMDDDIAVRTNRVNLLRVLNQQFIQIANISVLQN
ncbi:MAG: glycyl-tRNA synthetase beta chain [Pseudomonadales bacterium]|jgi:glycyl-tRNA synthetase beta chain